RCERRRPMLVATELRPDEPVDYLAGQYVGIRYRGTSRAYSLSSSPNRERLELCVRRMPGGRLSPRICEDLSVGDEVTVRGPYGDLVLGNRSARDVVFLATGTGVAPFKGMIDYLFEEGLDEYRGTTRDVWLFLGAAWADDLPDREAFREHHRTRTNFHFVPCLSRETALTDWDGETDYVQHAFLKHVDPATVTAPLDERLETWLGREPDSGVAARIDPGNAEVYACGINAMVHSLVATAEHVGVPPEHIESEGFG
ncbi:MAG: ferredoxin--NADP reductase, partial [Halobacteriaceae archaeon]